MVATFLALRIANTSIYEEAMADKANRILVSFYHSVFFCRKARLTRIPCSEKPVFLPRRRMCSISTLVTTAAGMLSESTVRQSVHMVSDWIPVWLPGVLARNHSLKLELFIDGLSWT